MPVLRIEHTTVYRYAQPVSFGEHRLMFRPRDSHDMRLIATSLAISPKATIRWYHDVFSNSIAVASFEDRADRLEFASSILLELFPGGGQNEFSVAPHALHYPFSYSADEMPDLNRTVERHYPDERHLVDAWARRFVSGGTDEGPLTLDVLAAMTRAIHTEFGYERRPQEGTMSPVRTLMQRRGTCRDFSLLMMEAARSLGFAARFVSGYLYDPDLASGDSAVVGAGETHAWVQIYLPGAGWIEFDPTNGLVGGTNLIRVAVTRDPHQASPLSGSFTGPPGVFLGMDVAVTVTAEARPAFQP